VFGDAQLEVRRLFRNKRRWTRLWPRIRKRFMTAWNSRSARSSAPPNDKTDLKKFVEPVGEVVRQYRRIDLDLAAVPRNWT